MRLATRMCTWTLAAVAVVALPACRAPSGGVEDDPAPAVRDADAPTPDAAQPQGNANEPTAHAGDRAAEAVDPARDSAALGEAVPAEPSTAATTPEPSPAAGEPSEIEPSEIEAKAAPEPPEAEPTEPKPRTKSCRRPGPRQTGPLRDLVGLDEAAVRRCLGEPERTEGSTWHYRWPQGCAYEVSRVVVRFARGKVASAHAKHEITGQHCGGDF